MESEALNKWILATLKEKPWSRKLKSCTNNSIVEKWQSETIPLLAQLVQELYAAHAQILEYAVDSQEGLALSEDSLHMIGISDAVTQKVETYLSKMKVNEWGEYEEGN